MATVKQFDGTLNPNGIPNNKIGNVWTASVHIFCGIVGAGILALPNAMAMLGWASGPLLIIIFYLISVVMAYLLADVYEVDGIEFRRYHDCVSYVLGPYYAIACSVAQLLTLVLANIAYTVAAGTAMQRIAELACEYNGSEDCWDTVWKLTVIFGATLVPVSLAQNLEKAWWVSLTGVITSLVYSLIAVGLVLHYAPNRKGSAGGITTTSAGKAFGVLGALGNVSYAYNFELILLEIMDTIRQPPKAAKSMKIASTIGISLSFVLYIIIAVGGYSALGNEAPGFVFAAFPSAPRWLMLIGNILVLLHMYGAYMVYGQPVFDTIESYVKVLLKKRAARASAGLEGGAQPALAAPKAVDDAPLSKESSDGEVEAKRPGEDGEIARKESATGLHRRSSLTNAANALHRLSRVSAPPALTTGFADTSVPSNEDEGLPIWQRFIIRAPYVIFTTVIACCLPFFADMAGLVGAISFWPLTIFFPSHLYRKVYHPKGWFAYLLWALEIGMFFVAVGSIIGTIRGIVIASKNYKVFG